MSNTKIFKSHGPSGKVPIKAIDAGDGDYLYGVSIKDRPAPYAVTLTASGSVKSTPGRLFKVIADVATSSPTIKFHNGSSASDAALLASAARTLAAVGEVYDFGDDGISFDALYLAISGTATIICVVGAL